MNVVESGISIKKLGNFINDCMGVYYPEERLTDLKSRISAAADSLGFPGPDSCAEWLLSSPNDTLQHEILVGCVTVGETYFFREFKSLKALNEKVFPEIVKARRGQGKQVKIWSAGCSTGEEAYTLAMMVSEHPELKGWDVSILATDINRAALEKAERGVYTDWSFRGVPVDIRDRFFKSGTGKTYTIREDVKNLVSFSYLNLMENGFPALLTGTSGIDLILCRNVLMYFKANHATSIIGKFHQSLVPRGWLLVSPVEASLVTKAEFTPMVHSGAVVHRKTSQEAKDRPEARKARRPVLFAFPAGKKRADPVDERFMPLESAKTLYGKADYRGAIGVLKGVAPESLDSSGVYRLIARSYANMRMLEDAEKWCKRAFLSDPSCAVNQYLMALIKIEQRQPEEAVLALRKAICLDPDFVVAHFALSHLCRARGNAIEADRHIKNVLMLLEKYKPWDELPESEGMTAGAFAGMILGAIGGNGPQGPQYATG